MLSAEVFFPLSNLKERKKNKFTPEEFNISGSLKKKGKIFSLGFFRLKSPKDSVPFFTSFHFVKPVFVSLVPQNGITWFSTPHHFFVSSSITQFCKRRRCRTFFNQPPSFIDESLVEEATLPVMWNLRMSVFSPLVSHVQIKNISTSEMLSYSFGVSRNIFFKMKENYLSVFLPNKRKSILCFFFYTLSPEFKFLFSTILKNSVVLLWVECLLIDKIKKCVGKIFWKQKFRLSTVYSYQAYMLNLKVQSRTVLIF